MAKKILYVASRYDGVTNLIQEQLDESEFEFGNVHTEEEVKRKLAEGDYEGVFFETLKVGRSSLDDYCRGGLDLVASACEKGLPVMVLSGAGFDILEKAEELGARKALGKPFKVNEIPGHFREVFGDDAKD